MSQTLGQKRVKAEFNPAKSGLVDQIKNKSAELIDLVEKLRVNHLPDNSDTGHEVDIKKSGECQRLISISQTEIETACMYAVKANFTD